MNIKECVVMLKASVKCLHYQMYRHAITELVYNFINKTRHIGWACSVSWSEAAAKLWIIAWESSLHINFLFKQQHFVPDPQHLFICRQGIILGIDYQHFKECMITIQWVECDFCLVSLSTATWIQFCQIALMFHKNKSQNIVYNK